MGAQVNDEDVEEEAEEDDDDHGDGCDDDHEGWRMMVIDENARLAQH